MLLVYPPLFGFFLSLALLFRAPELLEVLLVALLPLRKIFNALLSSDESERWLVDLLLNYFRGHLTGHPRVLALKGAELRPHPCDVLKLFLEIHDEVAMIFSDSVLLHFPFTLCLIQLLDMLSNVVQVPLRSDVVLATLDHPLKLVQRHPSRYRIALDVTGSGTDDAAGSRCLCSSHWEVVPEGFIYPSQPGRVGKGGYRRSLDGVLNLPLT